MPRRPRPVPLALRCARTAVAAALGGCSLLALAQAEAPAEPARERVTAATVFARADINRDGKLSRDEAARFPAFAERFDQLDADRDGSLSPEEFVVGFNAPQ